MKLSGSTASRLSDHRNITVTHHHEVINSQKKKKGAALF